MNVLVLTKEELKNKLLKAFIKDSLCQYKGENLNIVKMNGISEIVVDDTIHEGTNDFSCRINARVHIEGLEEIKRLQTLNASFLIDEKGNFLINEPLILVDC